MCVLYFPQRQEDLESTFLFRDIVYLSLETFIVYSKRQYSVVCFAVVLGTFGNTGLFTTKRKSKG